MKKSIALILTIILGMTLLAGCGGDAKTDENNNSQGDNKGTNPPVEIKGITVEMNDFTILCPDGWEDQTDNPSYSKFQKNGANVGCDIVVQFSGSGLDGWEDYDYDKVSYNIGGYFWEGYFYFGDMYAIAAKITGSDKMCVVKVGGYKMDDPEIIAIIESIKAK